jgi:hypothetical protein
MKKIIYLPLILGLLIISCSEDFLDLKPISSFTSADFYQTPKDIEQAVSACYNSLQGYYNRAASQLLNVRSDQAFHTNYDDKNIGDFTMVPSTGSFGDIWRNGYKGVNLCNLVLSKQVAVEMAETDRNQYVCEAKFIRALYYYHMVRVFGDIPVVRQPVDGTEAMKYLRLPIDSAYNLIISDLKDAANKLPASYAAVQTGRATSWSAKGLLASVYATRKQWSLAKTVIEDIIASNKFDLLPTYASVFKLVNENSKECLFSVDYKAGGTGTANGIPGNSVPATVSQTVDPKYKNTGNTYALTITEAYYNSFSANDVRRNLTIATSYPLSATVTVQTKFCIKYLDPTAQQSDGSSMNNIVQRYAEICLLYAEVLNELGYDGSGTGAAWTYLNKTKVRAGLAPATAADFPNQASFRKAVFDERNWEFGMEGMRWYDLIRSNTAENAILAAKGITITTAKDYLFPVPLGEIQVNPNLVQNPGYN